MNVYTTYSMHYCRYISYQGDVQHTRLPKVQCEYFIASDSHKLHPQNVGNKAPEIT